MATKRDIINVPVGDLRPHPRQALVYGETMVDVAFVESIKRTGILQMPVVKVDDEDFGFVIISGHRRVEAAKQAGFTHVECEVRSYESVEDEEYDFYIANKQRKKSQKQILAEIRGLLQLSRQNLSENCKVVLHKEFANGDKIEGGENASNGASHQSRLSDREIARITGLPKDTVHAYTCIFDMDYRAEVINEFVQWGVKPEEAAKQVNALWDSQIPRVESGEVQLRDVYRALLDAKRDALQRIDAAVQRRARKIADGNVSRGNNPTGLKHPKAVKAVKEAKAVRGKIENTTGAASDFLNQMARNNEVPAEDSREFLVTFAWKYCDYILKSNK